MKKKFIMLTLLIMVSITTVSCKNNDAQKESQTTTKNKTDETETIPVDPEQAENRSKGDISDLDALDDVEVEKELFDVNLTIPAQYIGELDQAKLEQQATEGGYKITMNDDGSATYTMTKSQHKKLMEEMSSTINSSLSEMISSGNYPNFTDITANEDFTNFTVTTKSTELDVIESFSTMALYMYGGMYGIFNGKTPENIHIDFINADSGETIESTDSSNMTNNG